MIHRIWLIASNAFIETIRQPVYGLVVLIAGYLIGFSPCFAMFTLLESVKLVRDMGLGSMMLAGLALSVFSASNVIAQEIHTKTVLTLLAKPVGRFEFIVGKYFGIAAGLAVAMYLLTVILVLTVRLGVPDAVTTPLDYLALGAELAAVSSAILIGMAANYFFDKSFTASAVLYGLVTFTVCLVAVAFVNADGKLQPFSMGVDLQLVKGCVLVLMGVLVLAAAAVAVSARADFGITLVVCVLLFLLGLVSDYLFGQHAANNVFARVAYAAVPNLQVFWVVDALNDGKPVPVSYVLRAGGYAGVYASGLIFVALSLFQEREIS